MDRLLLERLIGAGVLVALLVFIVPAILDGDSGSDSGNDSGSYSDKDSGSSSGGKSAGPAPSTEPRRTHTIRLDQSTERPPVAREVSEPAASGSLPEPVVAADPQAAQKSTADVKPKPVVNTKPKAESKVIVAPPVKSAPVKSTPVKSASVPTAGWVVQLGSFSNKQNAQRLTDEVSARGFPAFMMPLKRSGKKLYRVRVGPRNTKEQATDLAGRLAKVGYTGQVTRQLPDA